MRDIAGGKLSLGEKRALSRLGFAPAAAFTGYAATPRPAEIFGAVSSPRRDRVLATTFGRANAARRPAIAFNRQSVGVDRSRLGAIVRETNRLQGLDSPAHREAASNAIIRMAATEDQKLRGFNTLTAMPRPVRNASPRMDAFYRRAAAFRQDAIGGRAITSWAVAIANADKREHHIPPPTHTPKF